MIRRLRRSAVIGLAALALASSDAVAGTELHDGANYFALSLDDTWTPVDVAGVTDGPIAGFRHADSGAVLAVSRVDVANPAAWRGDKRFFREVEDGVAATTPGYKRLRSKRRSIDDVPVLDLVFSRDGAAGIETTALRIVFFRTFSLSWAVSAQSAVWKQHEHALTAAAAGLIPER